MRSKQPTMAVFPGKAFALANRASRGTTGAFLSGRTIGYEGAFCQGPSWANSRPRRTLKLDWVMTPRNGPSGVSRRLPKSITGSRRGSPPMWEADCAGRGGGILSLEAYGTTLVEGLPQRSAAGRRRGSRSQRTPGGRTYWGGALFCTLAGRRDTGSAPTIATALQERA